MGIHLSKHHSVHLKYIQFLLQICLKLFKIILQEPCNINHRNQETIYQFDLIGIYQSQTQLHQNTNYFHEYMTCYCDRQYVKLKIKSQIFFTF